ncbi:MAG: protein kinase [Planctomycetota bacterium]
MSAGEPPRPDASRERALIDAALAQVRRLRPETGTGPLPELPGYELLEELHRGGQGVVYRGVQRTTGQEVAVKVLREEASSERARALFEREIDVLARLRHPALVAIHDCGVHQGRLYYAMEFVPGRDLDEELAARPRSLRATVELLALVCEAVGAAHTRGVLHRDLKPRNIRIDEHGRVRLLDFGLAKWLDQETGELTAAGGFLGSAPWASPEQVAGEPLDARSDAYALGVIAYQALTGAFPYPVDGPLARVFESIRAAEPVPPRRRSPELDADLETILLTALAKAPERRYQSAPELARDLRHWLARRPIDARRDSMLYVLGEALRRHWLVSSAAIGVLVVIAASSVAVARSRSLWRDLARQLDARLHAERLVATADAWRRGDSAALEAQLATAANEQRDWAARHFLARLERQRWSFAAPEERLLAAAWSPDGARLAVGTWEGSVRMLEAERGEVLWQEEGELLEVRDLAFDPEGERLLVLESRALHELAAETGARVRTQEWPAGGLERLSVAPDCLLIGGNGGNVALLTPAGEVLRAVQLAHPEPGVALPPSGLSGIQMVALDAGTRRVASVGRDLVRVWDALTGELLHSSSLGMAEKNVGLAALAFSPDGRRVAVGWHPGGTTPGVVLVLDAATGRRLAALENLEESPAPLQPLEESCWIGSPEGVVRRFALPGGRLLDQLPGFGVAARLARPAPGGSFLAVLAERLALWELDPPAPSLPSRGPRALARRADGRWWQAGTGIGDRGELTPFGGVPIDAGLSLSDPEAIALDTDGILAVWRGGTVELRALDRDGTMRWDLGVKLRRAALAGDIVVVAAGDGSLVRLDPADASSRVLARGPSAPGALAVSATALAVAAGARLELRDVESGVLRAGLGLEGRETIEALAFLGGPPLVAAGTDQGRLLLLDLEQGLILCDLALAPGRLAALSFDPERDELGSIDLDGRLEIRTAARPARR